MELPPFPTALLGTPPPKFTKEMDKILLDFVKEQEGLLMDPEFIKWKSFPFDKVGYTEISNVLIYVPYLLADNPVLFSFQRRTANTLNRGIGTSRANWTGFSCFMTKKFLICTGLLKDSDITFSLKHGM
jgi:hypothetical protein